MNISEYLEDTNIRCEKFIKDPKLSIDRLEKYSLSIFISSTSIRLAVIDKSEKQILLLEKFVFEPTDDKNLITEVLNKIFYEHTLLKAGFWNQINVILQNAYFTQVPSMFFDKHYALDLVKLSGGLPNEPMVPLYTQSKIQDLVHIFAISAEVKSFFDTQYPNITINYQHKLQNIFEVTTKSYSRKVGYEAFLHLDDTHITISICKNGKLQLINEFLIKNDPNKLLKALLGITTQLNIDNKSIQLVVWSDSSQTKKLLKPIRSYFPKAFLGIRPPKLRFSYLFDDIAKHEFFFLLHQVN
ncbi:MAG: DUF3822 family protein [Cyclobacteriaceae bacterium]|nr:DUF3822 family protein [Cyclobacteriaceae bacterium]MCH8516713.1 DUF3822 family protein [Cyclobacteriaceae bacterium]